MKNLNEKQLKYGFDHIEAMDKNTKFVVELSEYNHEKNLIIGCTQLNENYKEKDKRRILNKWINFLKNNSEAFTELTFVSRVPQELFNAICHQKNLKFLYIKWGSYPDISMISQLKNLRFLHIGSEASVGSIEPISSL